MAHTSTSLFDLPSITEQPKRTFRGETFDPELDGERLDRLLDRVRNLMLDGHWRNLAEISSATGGTEASCSARLRDLRRVENGGYQVDRRRVGEPSRGIWVYRVTVKQ